MAVVVATGLVTLCASSCGHSAREGFSDGGSSEAGGFGEADSSVAVCPPCSADLHDVLDCSGRVIQTCPSDQGCANGQCVPACSAAVADKSSIGCDYFVLEPDAFDGDLGSCFAAYVVNTWNTDVTLQVDRAGVAYDPKAFALVPSGGGRATTYAPMPSGKLATGQVAVVFLSGDPSAPEPCPAGVSPALAADGAFHGTGIGTAFHLSTSAPVVAFDIYPYGGGDSAITSATLLLPTSVWGTNYLAVDAYSSGGLDGFDPWVAIVAQTDGTHITLSPTADLVGGPGVAATGKGQPHTYALDRGQVLQLRQSEELIGTPIEADQPVGVWGGAKCMYVPNGIASCDSGHQQIPPVGALGHEYVAVKPPDRYSYDEAHPWRIVGAVDGTRLTYEPSTPPGAPTTIDARAFVEFDTQQPFIVRSQDDAHPFYMAGYMMGCTAYWVDSGRDCRGDPEFVGVVPSQQYLSSYVFFTDPTYPETHLVVVRQKVGGRWADVSLDCMGTVGGWQALGSSYEWTHVTLVSGNFEKNGACDNGRHEMKSGLPFGVTVWGWGSEASGGQFRTPTATGFYSQAVSYAFPAGASIRTITTAAVPPTTQ
jgi:hypothetical protein